MYYAGLSRKKNFGADVPTLLEGKRPVAATSVDHRGSVLLSSQRVVTIIIVKYTK